LSVFYFVRETEKQNPFPRPHFAFPTATVMAEDKFAATPWLIFHARMKNGKL
jgi:hypothetical protein